MKRLVIDFYRIEVPAGYDLVEILRHASHLPNNETRTANLNGGPVRLNELADRNRKWEGDLARIRMEQLPSRASVLGPREDLDLEDHEGLGEDSAFIFDPQLRVLAMQRNRRGATPSSFARYFERIGQIEDGPIDYQLILRPDVLARLEQMQDIRKFRIKLSSLQNGAILRDSPTLGGAVDIIEATQAPQIDITVSVGHQWRDRRLRANRIIQAARRILRRRQAGESVDHIEIKGLTADGEADEFDLITERVHQAVEVELAPNRTLPFQRRISAVRTALREQRQYLR